eukprot:SAG11_NODE_1063_length_5996_cov_2.201798_8_plen_175_part_00
MQRCVHSLPPVSSLRLSTVGTFHRTGNRKRFVSVEYECVLGAPMGQAMVVEALVGASDELQNGDVVSVVVGSGCGGAEMSAIGLLEPHKRFQNSVSIFQVRSIFHGATKWRLRSSLVVVCYDKPRSAIPLARLGQCRLCTNILSEPVALFRLVCTPTMQRRADGYAEPLYSWTP